MSNFKRNFPKFSKWLYYFTFAQLMMRVPVTPDPYQNFCIFFQSFKNFRYSRGCIFHCGINWLPLMTNYMDSDVLIGHSSLFTKSLLKYFTHFVSGVVCHLIIELQELCIYDTSAFQYVL